jgi:hypothetical protein
LQRAQAGGQPIRVGSHDIEPGLDAAEPVVDRNEARFVISSKFFSFR